MSLFGNIYTDSELPHRACAVYMYLRDRAGCQGVCWPGINTIAADLKLSRSTVKRALRDLEQAGLLKKTRRFRDNGSASSNLYSL
ncbi:helix-turn-helix domain-containing protein [Pseudoflavonifractor phocaeensis]|uniref:helix-turn-helix domain-containing protein n=1 Tax=Pseudoflavonifractor phocaeensis TaxID=1870988 RepID=UPI00210F1475|nr:helix-turn-helix domain-containing protein [Pseudoflavonifractor phocaeensis]